MMVPAGACRYETPLPRDFGSPSGSAAMLIRKTAEIKAANDSFADIDLACCQQIGSAEAAFGLCKYIDRNPNQDSQWRCNGRQYNGSGCPAHDRSSGT